MVFDIGNLHVKGREWKVGKRRSRDLLLKDAIGRGGKREGRGREKREKKGRGAAFPNNKKLFPRRWPVSINLAARLRCSDVMAPNGIRQKAEAVKPQIPKPRPKLSVPRPARWPMHPERLLLSRPRQRFIICLEIKHVKGYFAML